MFGQVWAVCRIKTFLYCCSLDSDEDRGWIDNVMNYCGSSFPLEDKYGFRFVEQERDFMLGQLEMENITTAVEQSRRMIIVLSR